MRYVTIGPPAVAGMPDSLRGAVTAHPFAPNVIDYAPFAVRRAQGWTPPVAANAPRLDAADAGPLAAAIVESDGSLREAEAMESDEPAWPGDPSTWGEATRIAPLDRAVEMMRPQPPPRAGAGAAVARARSDPSRYALE